MVPSICKAQVVSQDPDHYGLNVILLGAYGGQMPSLPVQVGTPGPRDGVRGSFHDLPQPGTHGLVAFPAGDLRNGTWLCAIQPALNDASTLLPGNLGIAYAAHYGGGWSWRGTDGTLYEAWPEGSTFLVGSSIPSPVRHIVDQNGQRQQKAFPLSERVPKPPGSFRMAFLHPTGASVTLTASGAWTLNAAPGQTATLVVSGGASVTLEANGSILVVPAAGQPVTVSGELHVTGQIYGGYGGADQIGLLSHHHPQGPDSRGDTEQNTGSPVPGT